jgi:hypothetical protein
MRPTGIVTFRTAVTLFHGKGKIVGRMPSVLDGLSKVFYRWNIAKPEGCDHSGQAAKMG